MYICVNQFESSLFYLNIFFVFCCFVVFRGMTHTNTVG